MGKPAYRQCRRCGILYPLNFFRISRTALYAYSARLNTLCLGCEQAARDADTQRNRWLAKANATTRLHARSLSIPARELREEQGFVGSRMAHDAEHAYANGCSNCGHSYAAMGHGLNDITLDVIDRTAPVVYGINTRWICATCNRQKGTRTVTQMAEINIGWARWNGWKQQAMADPFAGTMFERRA